MIYLEALEVAPEEDPELEAPVVLAADPEEVLPLVAEAEEPAEVETAWPTQLESARNAIILNILIFKTFSKITHSCSE